MPLVQLLTFNKSNDGPGEYCVPNASLMNGNWQTQPSWLPKNFRSCKPQQASGNQNPASTSSRWLPATTDQEMADLLKQTFQNFYQTDKGSTPTFHPRTEIRMATLPHHGIRNPISPRNPKLTCTYYLYLRRHSPGAG